MERILAQYRKNCLQANKFFDASAKVVHPDKNNKESLSAHRFSRWIERWRNNRVRKLHLRLYRLICFASRFKSNWSQPSYRLAVDDTEKWLPNSLNGEKLRILHCPSEDLSHLIRHIYLKLALDNKILGMEISIKMRQLTMLDFWFYFGVWNSTPRSLMF